jgi:hypothetical protein
MSLAHVPLSQAAVPFDYGTQSQLPSQEFDDSINDDELRAIPATLLQQGNTASGTTGGTAGGTTTGGTAGDTTDNAAGGTAGVAANNTTGTVPLPQSREEQLALFAALQASLNPNPSAKEQAFIPASHLLQQNLQPQSQPPASNTESKNTGNPAVSPSTIATPVTTSAWHSILSPNQENTPLDSLKSQQANNLAAFELESKYFAKPDNLPPGTLVEINGDVKEALKVTQDGRLPSSDAIFQGFSTLLSHLGFHPGSDISIHLVFDPTNDKLKNKERFSFLFLVSPAILSTVTADRSIVYPTSQLQALRLALFDKLYPQGYHKNIPGVPAILKCSNVRPLSINSTDCTTIGFLTIPPEFAQGSKYDSQAHQYIGERFLKEFRDQLKQEDPTTSCPIPVIPPVRAANLIAAQPYPEGKRQKGHQSLSKRQLCQFSNTNTLLAIVTSNCDKGRHLASIILANAVDPTTNSARTFTSIFPGVLPFTFIPRPHDSQELPKIYAHIKGEHAIMRKTFESISIPHLTRLLIDASPAQQHNIFSTISSKLHPTSVATITFHFHRSSIVPQYNIIIGVTYQTIGITPESIMQQLSLILPDLIPTTANSPGVDINLLLKNPSIGSNVTPPTSRAQSSQSTGKPSRPSYRSSVLAILPNSSINPSQSHPNPQAQAQGQGHPGINSEPPVAGFNPNLFYAVFSVKGVWSPAPISNSKISKQRSTKFDPFIPTGRTLAILPAATPLPPLAHQHKQQQPSTHSQRPTLRPRHQHGPPSPLTLPASTPQLPTNPSMSIHLSRHKSQPPCSNNNNSPSQLPCNKLQLP